MKKRRLKKWVKYLLLIILSIILGLLLGIILEKGISDFEDLSIKCNKEKGTTCSYYEIRQYSLRK